MQLRLLEFWESTFSSINIYLQYIQIYICNIAGALITPYIFIGLLFFKIIFKNSDITTELENSPANYIPPANFRMMNFSVWEIMKGKNLLIETKLWLFKPTFWF